MKHNWSARCQYNVTGWDSMWAYDMVPLRGSINKEGIIIPQIDTSSHRFDHHPHCVKLVQNA